MESTADSSSGAFSHEANLRNQRRLLKYLRLMNCVTGSNNESARTNSDTDDGRTDSAMNTDRSSRLAQQVTDPIDEYFEMCRDSDGNIHPGKVRYALAYAYRFGFLEGKEKYKPVHHEIPCSVPVPDPVLTEKEIQLMVDRVKESLGLKGPAKL